MKEWDDFLDKQEKIYEKFRVGMETAVIEGLKPDPVIAERKGGYLIFLRPAKIVVDAVAKASRCISELVPGAVAYNAEEIHTSISDYRVAPNFLANRCEDYPQTLELLSLVIRDAWKEIAFTRSLACAYNGYVFNQTTVIMTGRPFLVYFMLAIDTALQSAAKMNIVLQKPWGAHITVARFGQQNSPGKAKELEAFCKKSEYPIYDFAFPYESINLGEYSAGLQGFRLKTICSYSLSL